MVNNTVSKLISNYLRLTTWFAIYEDDQSVSVKQFEAVLGEIGHIEEELAKNGVSDDAITKLSKFITRDNLLHKPLEKFNEEQQLMILKCIFGGEVEWAT